ncbi:MAG: hypothetical protein KGI27_12525 [Thaumarchaeota archaeon]|nr:hypothetical protein [Nitrososphaerota archaeon]
MKRRYAILIIIAIVVPIAGVYGYYNYFGPQTVIQTNSGPNCRQGNVLDGADRQARFLVLSTCEKAVGVVHDMSGQRQADDGDYQFNIDVDEPYKRLLNDDNIKQVNGMLVVEIVPKDQNNPDVTIPKNGDRIEVYGAWVTDRPHGWNEIHPAWKITVIK